MTVATLMIERSEKVWILLKKPSQIASKKEVGYAKNHYSPFNF